MKTALVIDDDAAGFGWFLDPTPATDEEFAESAYEAEERMDLLTAVMHELGHLLGRDHADDARSPAALMSSSLSAGQRRLPG